MNDGTPIKKPHWGGSVVAYLAVGGIAGASGLLAEIARRSGARALERRSRVSALVAVALCPPILISHLGRPERFLNMLRTINPRSPMSVGVWGLVGYSMICAANLLPDAPLAQTSPLQALLGGYIAGYTGVLLSATAVPIWAKGKVHIPAISVCASVAGACAVAALLVPRDEPETLQRLARLEVVAAAAEGALLLDFERKAGQRLAAPPLAVGIAMPLLLHASLIFGRNRNHLRSAMTLAASALTLAGGYLLRRALIDAAKQ